MPQLDFFSISNQFFWGIFYFILFFLLTNFFIVPSIFSSIFARQSMISNSGAELSDPLIYTFASLSLFISFLAELEEWMESSIYEIEDSDENFFFSVRVFLSFEVGELKIDLFDQLDLTHE
jgi:Plant ATP synthase F0